MSSILESRTKNIINNIAASLMLQVINIIVGFLIPQIFLKEYGSSYYGLVFSIQQFLTYFTLLEVGLGASAIFQLYKYIALCDYEKINSILTSVKKFYNRIALYYFIALIVLSFIYPFFVKDNITTTTIIGLIFVMGCSGLIEFKIQAKFRVLLTADQKLSVLNNFITISQLGGLLIRLLLIYFDYSIVIVQSSFTAFVIIRAILIKVYVNYKYADINFNTRGSLIHIDQRAAVLIQQLTGLIVYNTPTVLLTIFVNLKTVSVYAVYSFIFSSIYAILSNIFSLATTASFGSLLATGSAAQKRLIESFRIFEFLYYNILFIIFSVTVILIVPFIRLYTRNVTDIIFIDYKITTLFIIVGLLNSIRIPMIMLINAAGHYEETKYRAIKEALINITISACFIYDYGILGVLIGSLASFSYRCIDMIYYVNKKILHQSPIQSIKFILQNLFLSGLIISTIVYLNKLPEIDSWLVFLNVAVFLTLIITMIFFLVNLYFNTIYYKKLKSQLQLIWTKF